MSTPARISKSRFTRYVQCPRLGYLQSYPDRFKHLADPLDWLALHLIGEGTRAGELARDCFPGGVLIGHVWNLGRACAETAVAMRNDAVSHLFEPAFAVEGLLCRVDVLCKAGDGEVDLIEVKAANSAKAEHLPDVGFQLAVLERSGLSVRSVGLMHFNPDYVHPDGGGGAAPCGAHGAASNQGYDLAELFVVDDVTQEARRWVAENLDGLLGSMRADLARAEPPRVPLRHGCKECAYYRQFCAPAGPLHPVCELGADRGGLFAALYAAGIEDVRDVPPDFPGLGAGHALVLEAAQTKGLVFKLERLSSLMEELEPPLLFADFETFMAGLPIYAGTRPWQQIPFQWSLYILEADGSVRHEEFLKADGDDPRRAFAESLLGAVGSTGRVVVYNKGMESTRLKELARDFPDLAEALDALDARIFDLLPVVRQCCYHLDLHGSRSLKSVTPVVAPHLSYEALGLKAGLQAMEAYERLVSPATSDAQRAQVRADLLQYCALDTLAMVEIVKRFRSEMGKA